MVHVLLIAVVAVQWSWAFAAGRAGSLVLAVAVTLASVLFLSTERRRPPARLRWDGAHWSMHSIHRGRRIERTGEVTVVADLGSWILVVFRPEVALEGGRSSTPLVLSRRVARAEWHALRCALYSPRPAPVLRPQGPA